MTKNKSGFTLIELIVAVAIVGILATIAVPSYQDSVRKSRRRDAQGALVSFANAMERQFTAASSYCDVGEAGAGGTNTCGVAGTNDTGKSTVFSDTSPVDGGTAAYNLKISAVTATTFTLQAIPTGPQTGDTCGTMTLTQTGARANTGTLAGCW